MAVLERFGLGARPIGILFLLFTLVIYAVIGWLSRTMQVDAYYVAGREVPGSLQRHGHGGRLDVGRELRGAGRRHLLRRLPLPRLHHRLDRRLRAGERADGALPAQVRLLHGPRLHRHPLRRQPRAVLRGGHPRGRVLHLRDGADRRDRHHRLARARHPLRDRRLVRPARHPPVLDARRHARRHLDPGGAVHRADHRLSRAGDLDVERPGLRHHPALHLRRGGGSHRSSSRPRSDLRRRRPRSPG